VKGVSNFCQREKVGPSGIVFVRVFHEHFLWFRRLRYARILRYFDGFLYAGEVMVFGWQPFLESLFIHDSGDGVCMAILTNFCTALCWRRWSAVQGGGGRARRLCSPPGGGGHRRAVLPLKTGRLFVAVGQDPPYVSRGFAKTPHTPPVTPLRSHRGRSVLTARSNGCRMG